MNELDVNVEKLNGYLARHRESGIRNLIAGESRDAVSSKTFDTHSPVDETLIASVAHGDAEDIDAAAKAAHAAHLSTRGRSGRDARCRWPTHSPAACGRDASQKRPFERNTLPRQTFFSASAKRVGWNGRRARWTNLEMRLRYSGRLDDEVVEASRLRQTIDHSGPLH